MASHSLSYFAVIVLLGLGGLVVFAIIKYPKLGLSILAAVVILAVLVGGLLFARYTGQPSRVQVYPTSAAPPQHNVAPAPIVRGSSASSSSPAVSGSTDTDLFLADVYPSRESAAAAIARELRAGLDAIGPAGGTPLRLWVAGSADHQLRQLVARDLAKGQTNLPEPVVVNQHESGSLNSVPDSNAVLCQVRADDAEGGSVGITLRGPRGRRSQTAKFQSKPWVLDMGVWRGLHPGEQWELAHSEFQSSDTEADHEAMHVAAGVVHANVRGRIDQLWSRTQPTRSVPDSMLTLRLVQDELRGGALVRDRFTQRYSRPYGDLWRTTLLLDVSPRSMDELAGRIVGQLSQVHAVRQTWWTRTLLSAGGLAVVILLIYALVNAATRGYYAWSLRVLAGALIAVGVALVLMVA